MIEKELDRVAVGCLAISILIIILYLPEVMIMITAAYIIGFIVEKTYRYKS